MRPTLASRKPIDQLTPEDIRIFPIWEFTTDEEEVEGQDETWVRPVDAPRIPQDAFSLSVAANFVTPSGRRLCGIVGVSTFGGIVELSHGALVLDGAYMFVPSPKYRGARQEYREVAAKLGVPVDDVFPLKFELTVPVEGEVAPRAGEFGV